MIFCWNDFETGGLDSQVHSPLSFGMVIAEHGPKGQARVIHTWETQIRQEPIVTTPGALAVNKIDPKTPGITFAKFQTEYLGLIGKYNRPMCAGHNVAFDRPWLKRIMSPLDDQLHYHSVCTMVLANTLKVSGLMPDLENMKLETLVKYFGITRRGEAHGALSDAFAAMDVFCEIQKRLAWNNQ